MHLQVLLDWEDAPSNVDQTSISSVLDLLRRAETVDTPSETLQSVPRALFSTIQKWIALHQEKPLRNALVVWTKWFSLPENLLPTQEILCHPDIKYFDILQSALQDSIGHPALQKYLLHVLRKSMLLLKHHVHTESFEFDVERKWSYLADYNKYCSLFETIVIGRSVNQAEECLHQVPAFEQPLSVRQTWWTILFGAGLIQANSEPIRKLLAEFVFQNYYPTAEPGRHSGDSYRLFLAHSLLPYVMQGSLFTKSIQRSGKVIVSTHGEGLAHLCANLYESKETSETCGGTILRYLVANCNTLNPHATCYILQGLDENKTWEMTLEDAEFAVDLPFKTTFSQIQRVVLLRHCISIVSKLKSVEKHVPEDQAARQTHVQIRLAKLQSSLKEDSQLYWNTPVEGKEFNRVPIAEGVSANWRDDQFGQWIELVDGATQQAQWAEAPEQFLGSQALSHMAACASSDADFKDYVGEYAQRLFNLVQGKTFLWKPLAQALRDAYFQFPNQFPNQSPRSGNIETATIARTPSLGNANLLEHPQVEDVILEFINNPPLPRPEYLLDAAVTYREIDDVGNHILDVFADETTGHVCIFDMLNRLRPGHEAWGLQVLDRVLEPWLQQKEPVPMVAKWKRTTQTQAIIILLEKCVQRLEDARSYWDKIFLILALEPHPRFRFLLEWALVSISQRVTILETSAALGNSSLALRNFGLQMSISQLGNADHSNPKNISSLIKVAMQLALNPPLLIGPFSHEEIEADNLSLLTELIAMSASPKIPIRHEAQWCFPTLFAHCQGQGQVSITENPAFVAMDKFIRALDKYNAPPEARLLSSFDVGKDMNLMTLFEGNYLRVNPSELPLMRTADFEEVWARDTPETVAHIAPPCLPLGNGNEEWSYEIHVSTPKTQSLPSRPITIARPSTRKPDTSSYLTPRAQAPLQTKSLALDSSFTIPTLDDSLDFLYPSSAKNAPNGPILIASLIEFPHNLGGLSRASEIFGCTSLHVPDISVLKNQQFKNVSVRSEIHVKIEEREGQDLATWLRSQKEEGWTVVGVEQTDTSIIIGMPGGATDSTRLPSMPKRSIIVMGAEKTGIPADVLVECDVCVEIKQWGVTRSLNVQTAASCVLFEWRRIWGDGR
ncbi:hypothetical protein E2P81_ATG06107 [Venturia nashicola]|nr:hypothetical protein E2P81_ATG06107 [Venturia nashicola]